MLDTTITQTLAILDNNFIAAWSQSAPITPTLMFAWEHNYRAVNLSSESLSWSNNILQVDVSTSGANPVPLKQENGMKWAPYGYNSSDGWFAADINAYWNELDSQLPGSFSGDDDIVTDVTLAKDLYLGMYSGETTQASRTWSA